MALLSVAHRGMPTLASENTLRSFELALAYGAQGIELDVHGTADGALVVHHDPALPSGTELARTLLSDLKAQAPDLPTLGEVCAMVGGRAELFVEIKGAHIEEAVQKALDQYDGRAAIHSFDHDLIHRLAMTGTHRRLGILVEALPQDALHAMARTGALDLWPHHSVVSIGLVTQVHAFGGRVIPWTVNAAEDVERMRAMRVDGICTDDVRCLE